jgi:hypothetical protein
LKQLQVIEEREERERKSTNPTQTLKTETSTRLIRYFDVPTSTNDNNENRRKLSLSKNVRKLTLSTTLNITSDNIDDDASTENDVFDKSVDNQSTEVSSTLLSIRQEKESLVSDILQNIVDLRDRQLVEMTYRVRQRALASKYPSYVTKDFPSLYGRCFNLSMNMKILTQCQYADSSIAARVLSDFDILEKSLEAKLPLQSSSDLSSMLHQIKI